MTAVICPRKDMERNHADAIRALRSAGCRCIWAWGKSGYGPVTQCEIHRVIEAYENLTMTATA